MLRKLSIGKLVFQQFVVCCFSISYFGFWFWLSTTEHDILGLDISQKNNKKNKCIKEKNSKSNFNLIKSICFIKRNKM